MTLQEAKETTVFEIKDGKVIERNLYEKMCDSIDETTTPLGVGPRLFIEERTFEIDTADFDNLDDLEAEFKSIETFKRKSSREDFEELQDGTFTLPYFVISSWGVKGNNYRKGQGSLHHTFLSREEAEEELFMCLRQDYDADWGNSCNSYPTREEAEEALIETNS